MKNKIKHNNKAQNSPRPHAHAYTNRHGLKRYSLFISLINILEAGQSVYDWALF